MCHSSEVCLTYTSRAITHNVSFLPSLDNTEICFVRESQYGIVSVARARMVVALIYRIHDCSGNTMYIVLLDRQSVAE